MRGRWRTLRWPNVAREPVLPEFSEAFGQWLLGTLWALGLLGLVLRGESRLVPMLLGAGLFLMWAWRRDQWVCAIPAACLLSLVGDQLAPGGADRRVGYLDVLVASLALIAIARFAAARCRGRAVGPFAETHRVLPLPVAIVVLMALAPLGPLVSWLQPCAIGLALFFVCRVAAAARVPWAWPTLTLATSGIGLWTILERLPEVADAFVIGSDWWTGGSPCSSAIPLLSLASGLATGFIWPDRTRRLA